MTTAAKSTAPLTPRELERLKLIRLQERWTFLQMGVRMSISESTLHNVLEKGIKPRDTTLYQIRRFLESYGSSEKKEASA